MIIGYSLPPEDVESMEMITKAILDRRETARTALNVHLVLGPGEREAKIIKAILEPYDLHPQDTRMYTEHAFVNWPKTGYPMHVRGLRDR